MIDRKEIETFRDFLDEKIEKLEGIKKLIEDFEEKLTELQSEKEDYEHQIKDLKERIEQLEEEKNELDPKKAQLEIIEAIQEILDRTSFDIALRQKFERLIEITKDNRDSMDRTRISILLFSNFI
ncbi:MAG: hypothetical protein QMD50_00115 [Patescibacteria group bacterium]|nr:hypothetical protein [Patescibacteria group bacterium]